MLCKGILLESSQVPFLRSSWWPSEPFLTFAISHRCPVLMTKFWTESKHRCAYSMRTNWPLFLLVEDRAPMALLTTGKYQSSSYYNTLYHQFALLDMSPKSSSLHNLETIKTTMHRSCGISTAATSVFASTLLHESHLLNEKQRRMKTRKTIMNQTLKFFTRLITTPQLTHL